jgi:hypothetical protein
VPHHGRTPATILDAPLPTRTVIHHGHDLNRAERRRLGIKRAPRNVPYRKPVA